MTTKDIERLAKELVGVFENEYHIPAEVNVIVPLDIDKVRSGPFAKFESYREFFYPEDCEGSKIIFCPLETKPVRLIPCENYSRGSCLRELQNDYEEKRFLKYQSFLSKMPGEYKSLKELEEKLKPEKKRLEKESDKRSAKWHQKLQKLISNNFSDFSESIEPVTIFQPIYEKLIVTPLLLLLLWEEGGNAGRNGNIKLANIEYIL